MPTSNHSNTNQRNGGCDNLNESVLSTDSLLSTNTTASTINPFQRPNPPQKDYSAAFSILQSRYGTGGHTIPSPKSKPSNKLQNTNSARLTTGSSLPQGNSQMTLVSTPSLSNSTATTSTASNTPSSSTARSSDKKPKVGGIRSLFKGESPMLSLASPG
ncbi:hypothetical protein AN958_02118 [Leucoagaricus sp. SymC.cos]|nr:hypothetical protein AN958_02118 [Leucoagaricus sp. SymC.cos]